MSIAPAGPLGYDPSDFSMANRVEPPVFSLAEESRRRTININVLTILPTCISKLPSVEYTPINYQQNKAIHHVCRDPFYRWNPNPCLQRLRIEYPATFSCHTLFITRSTRLSCGRRLHCPSNSRKKFGVRYAAA